ncbi:hypothetical protein BLAT2472_100041 [Burkholderia latens]
MPRHASARIRRGRISIRRLSTYSIQSNSKTRVYQFLVWTYSHRQTLLQAPHHESLAFAVPVPRRADAADRSDAAVRRVHAPRRPTAAPARSADVVRALGHAAAGRERRRAA